MADPIHLRHLRALPPQLEALRSEATRQGFGFMDRLVTDWSSGANTFNRPGECFMGAFAAERLVGVGGLNIDPYLDRADAGRLRHVYVLGDWRRRGIGRMLVNRLLAEARRSFAEVRLRTDTDDAAGFYMRCGFRPADDAGASHTLTLG